MVCSGCLLQIAWSSLAWNRWLGLCAGVDYTWPAKRNSSNVQIARADWRCLPRKQNSHGAKLHGRIRRGVSCTVRQRKVLEGHGQLVFHTLKLVLCDTGEILWVPAELESGLRAIGLEKRSLRVFSIGAAAECEQGGLTVRDVVRLSATTRGGEEPRFYGI